MTHPLRVAENCTTHPLHKAQNLMTHPLSAPAHPHLYFLTSPLLQIMSKRKWDAPSQESIANVFKVNCVSYGTDFIEDCIDALKVWNH